MKVIKKTLLIIFILSLVFLSFQENGITQEIKQNVFLTDSSYPFFSSSAYKEQFSNVTTDAFRKFREPITTQAKAIIIDFATHKNITGDSREHLKEMLIGKSKMIVIVMGYGIYKDFLQEFLWVRTKARVEIPNDSEVQLYGKGLFNLGKDSDGPFLTINMVSNGRIPEVRQLHNISQIIDKTLKMKAEPPYWKRMGIQWNNYDSVFCGKYNQSFDVQKMENDGSNKVDYWMTKVTNESISGITAHKNGYKNKLNDTKIEMENPKQKIISYGPGGDVGKGGTATVTVGTSGPSVSWSWSTGKTSLKNLSDMSNGFCHWQVNYSSGGQEAESTYTWYPGIETQNPQDDHFQIKIENVLEWEKFIDTKLFRNRCRIDVDPKDST